MSTGYQIKDQSALYYLTLQVVDWVDVFTRQIYRDIVIDSLRFCQLNKGLQLFAYVIMSNHIHIIANSSESELSNTLRDFKKFTSRNILQQIDSGRESRKEWILNRFEFAGRKHSRNEKYQFWTHENHAVHLYSSNFMREKLTYLHNNPVRAGIVEKPEDYLYSSARNYAGMQGIIDVIILDLPWITY
jgi:REP element-mobilizing transposase RayT